MRSSNSLGSRRLDGALLLAVAVLGASACGRAPDRPPGNHDDHEVVTGAGFGARPEWRLNGGVSSLHELGSAIVSALAAGDTVRLESYRLTQREHNEMLWIEMPAARQVGPGFPVDLAWENISIRNTAGLRRLLAAYGGQPLAFRGITCTGEERHGPFAVLTDCRVTVAPPGGSVRRLQMFRSVVSLDGVYKIIRYERELE